MGKVLFLLDELPPTKSANGICVDRVIQALHKKEIESYCICWNAPKSYLADVRIISQKPWKKKIDRFSNGNLFYRMIFQLLRIAYKIKRIFLIPIWPVDSCITVDNFYREAVKLIDNDDISIVVAVNYPGETLLAMKRLKKHYGNRIKTVMYPLDVSYVNPYCGTFERKLSSYFCPRFMKHCSDYADALLVLENAIDIYEKNYSDRERKNFKICGIPLLEILDTKDKKSLQGEIHCLYSGTLQKQVRDPEVAFYVLNQIAKNVSFKVYFDLCGQIDLASKKIYDDGFFEFDFLEHGWVGEKELDIFLEDADVLISLGNTESHLIPSKLFKYMSTKKPIIHFALTEKDPCISYLKKYGNAKIVFATDNLKMEQLEDLTKFVVNRNSTDVDLKKCFPRCFSSSV